MFGADLSAVAPTGRMTNLFPGLYQRKHYITQIACDLELNDFSLFGIADFTATAPLGRVTGLAEDHIDSKINGPKNMFI